MNILCQRVKISLENQHYTMNDSWLSDCVDFYINDHENPTQNEITAFVMNQWVLYDIRETNNENGCLPRNLANQKITTLPGKYILQVDKMYDISTSKYKQIEKIRNVSSENIEATENENKTQDDKFQPWEPKSKRMLQLFLTDGIQDILAIEYKTIRFLKELIPGYKLMIKGPVICRKGVILLEENNIVEIGGEVDSLLVMNAVENVLARALNLDENPDPYNDKTRPKQNTQSTQKTAVQADDDFDLDSQAIDQIDQQIQHQNTNASKNASTSSNKQSPSSKISEFNYSYQAPSISSKTQNSYTSSAKNPLLNSGSTLKNQQNYNNEKMIIDFDDEGDSFLEMVDDSAFKTPSISKTSTAKMVTTKETLASKNKDDEFPVDDEIYDLQDSHQPLFSSSKSKSQSTTTKITSSPKTIYNEKNLCTEREINTSKANLKETPGIASSYRSTSKNVSENKETFVATPSVSDIDNLDLDDIDMDGFDDYFAKSTTNNLKNSKSSQIYTSSSPKVKSSNAFLGHSPSQFNAYSTTSSDATNDDNEFEQDLYEKYKNELLSEKKSSQVSVKSLSTLKSKEPVTMHISSQTNRNSSAKLSDKLKFDNKNKDYYNTNKKVEEKNCKLSEMSTGSLFKSNNADTGTTFETNKSSSNKMKPESKYLYQNLNADFQDDFDIEFEAAMEIDNKPIIQQKKTLKIDTENNARQSPIKSQKSQDPVDNTSDIKSTSSKRLMSPSTSSRQKLRCVERSPKDKTSSRKITDFFNKPKPKLIMNSLPFYEAICDVLENSREQNEIQTVVRGKVVNVVKLNLLKGESGSYFHLDGTITDGTANLDVVFSSDVLEEIVGYSTQDFILKRKRAKADPSIKDELREDLKKAQQILRFMNALMEIQVKKNEKTVIIGIKPLTEENKKQSDERLQRYKAEKNFK